MAPSTVQAATMMAARRRAEAASECEAGLAGNRAHHMMGLRVVSKQDSRLFR